MKHIKPINEAGVVRISLTEEDFKILISGGIVDKGNAQIALQDIGWERIYTIIKNNYL